ncbi:MAG: sucrose phosphorylase [Spirochaetia bacterium]
MITYPDSLGGDLSALRTVIDGYLDDAITGVHVLPFYPSSADRGFAPMTYEKVDPAFGSWEDIEALAAGKDLIVDFMVNHISRRSRYFEDFVEKKDASPYSELFIRYNRFWPEGRPTEEDLKKIYTRKPRPPYLEVDFADGSMEKVWCTFDYEQIDLDLSRPATRRFIGEQLRKLCERGARVIRLDAVAYTTKRPGTKCFFLEPEIWEYLAFITEEVSGYDVELLPEVHEHYTLQLELAEKGYRVYDFALPMLVLQALYDENAKNLKRWLAMCPRKQITTLDTHDGIGVVDVVDLMSPDDIDRTKENLFRRGAKVKPIYSSRAYNNLDVYQLNCTYYSALGDDDDAYLLARAIQFFAPGIPQVYYVGLLAGRNDIELLEKTKQGRDINRHGYTLDEIEAETRRDVVRRLFTLMRFRNRLGFFDGEFRIEDTPDPLISITRTGSAGEAVLEADCRNKEFTIRYRAKENTGFRTLEV